MADSFFDELGHMTHLVDDAVRTGDFSQLSDRIGDAVDRAADALTGNAADADYEEIRNGRPGVPPDGRRNGSGASANGPNPAGNRSGGYYGGRPDGTARDPFSAQKSRRNAQAEHAQKMRMEAEQRQQARKQQEAYEDRYFARPEDTGGGALMTVFGGIIAFIFIILFLFSAVTASYADGAGAIILTVFNAIVASCGAVVAVKGHRVSEKARRFNSYRKLLLPRLYMDVKDLSRQTGVARERVVADLDEFTEKGMIREGHFDDTKSTFMASDELYRTYRETKARSDELKREESEQKEREKAAQAEAAKYSPEVREILDRGQGYIADIHAANDAIEDPVVSEKLDRMEQIVRRIFDEVRKRPSLAEGLGLFMDYYLPTTMKLIRAYDSLDRQGIRGENIAAAQKEITSSLDTINDAFEKLLDGFFKETAMDVSSDINVMKMMMKQEGLTDDDLSAMKKQAAASRAEDTGNQVQEKKETDVPKTLTAPWDTSGGGQAQALEKEE